MLLDGLYQMRTGKKHGHRGNNDMNGAECNSCGCCNGTCDCDDNIQETAQNQGNYLMSENIEQMRSRHESEIVALQAGCEHKEWTDWMPYYWAPGHRCGDVRVCEHCGMKMDENPKVQSMTANQVASAESVEPV